MGKGERLMCAEGETQGTYYSVKYYDQQGRDLKPAIDSLLQEFDMVASLWVENSQIRRLNENKDSLVNAVFADLVQKSVEMNNFTNGAFDCTVGKLVRAWGFSYKAKEVMTDEKIDSLRKHCGTQPILFVYDDTAQCENRFLVRKPDAECEIDFNAIAQGYASDMVGRMLEDCGIDRYLVDIGGEVLAKGLKDNGKGWIVGIERPAENRYSSPIVETSIELKDRAVVTSGNYRKYYEKDGVRYSHTIDPSTGRPVSHTLLSVSVVDSSAWRADALATAFMVMGLEKSLQFIEEHHDDSGTSAVLFIYNDSDGYKIYETEGMRKLISNQQ